MVPRAALCFDLQPGGLVHHHPYYTQICSMVFWSRTRTYHFGLTPIFISALCRCTVKWSQVYGSPILCFSVLLSALQLRTLKCGRSTAFCNLKFSFVYLFLFVQVQFFVHPAGVGSTKVGPRSPAVHCQTAPCVTPCHMSTKIIVIIITVTPHQCQTIPVTPGSASSLSIVKPHCMKHHAICQPRSSPSMCSLLTSGSVY